MAASNPILQEALKAVRDPGTLGSFTSVQYADVIVKTGVLFGIGVVAAGFGWMFLPPSLLVVIGLGLVTFGIAIAAARQRVPSAPLPILYAVLEGALIGSISALFAVRYGSDLVVTALVATAIVFGVCLAVFRIPFVRNSNQGRKVFMIALFAYLGLIVVSLIGGIFFGLGGGAGIFGMGTVGLIVSVAAVLLASWSLVVDFGDVDRAVTSGYPEAESWRLALGLFISTVWLYLEILRLLSRSR